MNFGELNVDKEKKSKIIIVSALRSFVNYKKAFVSTIACHIIQAQVNDLRMIN
jgi:hypothetical protein